MCGSITQKQASRYSELNLPSGVIAKTKAIHLRLYMPLCRANTRTVYIYTAHNVNFVGENYQKDLSIIRW